MAAKTKQLGCYDHEQGSSANTGRSKGMSSEQRAGTVSVAHWEYTGLHCLRGPEELGPGVKNGGEAGAGAAMAAEAAAGAAPLFAT